MSTKPKSPEAPKTPKERMTSAIDALKAARNDQIDGKLGELKTVLESIKPEEQKTVTAEIELADLAMRSNADIQERAEKLGALAVISNIRIDLARLKGEVNAGKTEAQIAEESGVSKWLIYAGEGLKTGAGATWEGIKFVGDKAKSNASYAWKNIIVKPFSAVMGYFGVKNIQMPPVALHARSMFLRFAGGFMPKATREAMQKNLDEEFAFHAITGQANALVADLNAVRAGKTPPETPITLDFSNQLTQFRLLTEAERKEIPRKVLLMAKKGVTDITLETLIEESAEKKTETEKPGEKSVETETTTSIELASDGLPKSLEFSQMKEGVEMGKYGKVSVVDSPASVTVGEKTWKLKGRPWTVRAVLSFSFTSLSLDESGLNVSVAGHPLGRGSGKVPRGKLIDFLDHLANSSNHKKMMNADGEYTGVDLVRS